MVASHDMYIRTYGNGSLTPVVLIHGVGASGAYFASFAAELSKFYDVYCIDMPGYGKSSTPQKPLPVRELSDVVAACIIALQLESSIVIGHSMGCQVVAQLGKNHPQLCSKMILVSPTVYDKERTMFLQAWRLLQDSFHEPVVLNLRIIRDYARMGIVRYLRTSRSVLRDAIEETLRACNMPILIIRGEKDIIVPLEWSWQLARIAFDARVKEVPGAPHVVHYKKAEQLSTICKEFIDA